MDRDRDLWVEGLYEFIRLARNAYGRNPNLSESQKKIADREEELDRRRQQLLTVDTSGVNKSVRTIPRPQISPSIADLPVDSTGARLDAEERIKKTPQAIRELYG